MSTLCSQWEGARFGLYPTKIFIKIKQASRRLKRLACRMTMLTVMTMFLIYPFTLSHEHRHHRHLRHYRHTRAARGSGVHPRNVHVDDHMLCLQYTFATYSSTETVPASKSPKVVWPIRVNHTQIHSKILTRKSESDVDSLQQKYFVRWDCLIKCAIIKQSKCVV